MKTVLLVEDDKSLASALIENLKDEGLNVLWADSVTKAKEIVLGKLISCYILDVGLPDGDGFELFSWLKENNNAPVIFLTAMNTAEYRLKGYELGAEEFIPKPFHFKELLLRMNHVFSNHLPVEVIKLSHCSIDTKGMSISHDSGQTHYLSKKEFELLNLLILRSPQVVSRDEILNEVWGEDAFPSNRTIDNIIVKIRQVLGEDGKIIRSVRGVGYQWVNEGESHE